MLIWMSRSKQAVLMFSGSSELSRVEICGGTTKVSINTPLQETLYLKNGSSSCRVPCALEWAVKSTSDINKSRTIISNINFIKGGIAQSAFSNLSSYSILDFLSAIFPYSGQDSIFFFLFDSKHAPSLELVQTLLLQFCFQIYEIGGLVEKNKLRK